MENGVNLKKPIWQFLNHLVKMIYPLLSVVANNG